MPRSVSTPVMCVVRMTPLEIRVMVAFCNPMALEANPVIR